MTAVNQQGPNYRAVSHQQGRQETTRCLRPQEGRGFTINGATLLSRGRIEFLDPLVVPEVMKLLTAVMTNLLLELVSVSQRLLL